MPQRTPASWPRAVLTAALVLTAACGFASRPAADGLHCSLLDGDDLEAAWRRLVRVTWVGRETAPRVTSHQDRPKIELAIQQLLAVLQFVDPYNYADDSPAWMATEESRARAREQAGKILLELGRGAAPYVWQALEQELRFGQAQTSPEKFVPLFREWQRKLKTALDALEGERRQDPEYLRLADEAEALRPIVNLLAWLDQSAAELRREMVLARTDPERLKAMQAESARLEARRVALGDAQRHGQRMAELQARLAEVRKRVDALPNALARKADVEKARQELDRVNRTTAGLGQGEPAVTGGDPAMITVEDYSGELKGVLAQMGPEALPTLAREMPKAAPALRKIVEDIEKTWLRPEYAVPFALAAADGRTQVALGAEKFLRERQRRTAIPPLVEGLPKVPEAGRPALFAALKLVSGANLPDEIKAWTEWWAKEKVDAPATGPAQEEEEKK